MYTVVLPTEGNAVGYQPIRVKPTVPETPTRNLNENSALGEDRSPAGHQMKSRGER